MDQMRENLPVFMIVFRLQKLIRYSNRRIDFQKTSSINMLSDLNYEVNLPINIYMSRPKNVSVKNVSNTFITFYF